MPSLSVRVDALPRIHLGLLSMHEGAPRTNGGVGFAVDGPRAQIEVTRAGKLSLHDDRPFPMAPDELTQLANSLELFAQMHRLRQPADIRICGGMLSSCRNGSATAIRVATIEALAYSTTVPSRGIYWSQHRGRGGTSGIGVNTYFDGGLVCDLGRPND